MNKYYTISHNDWESIMIKLLDKYNIYAPTQKNDYLDYKLIDNESLRDIIYNIAKPTTPLKTFFLPVKENITSINSEKPRIIMGVPNCDLRALDILDEIYLDEDYIDPGYKQKRDETIIISCDCYEIQEHCHCTSYGINPFVKEKFDLSISTFNDLYIISVGSAKGEKFIDEIKDGTTLRNTDQEALEAIETKRKEIVQELAQNNVQLPDYKKTGELLKATDNTIWEKYATNCVSCGACATICPTCSCFLLIDKPGFEKVKQMDACQYPGFERVAGDEDPLHQNFKRFSNRYFCKYVWKPEKFESLACTGCGRCIEACIGKINKNELFTELAN